MLWSVSCMITFRIVGLVGFCSMFQTEFVNAGGLFNHCSCGLYFIRPRCLAVTAGQPNHDLAN